jgi:hypothetical protein
MERKAYVYNGMGGKVLVNFFPVIRATNLSVQLG